VKKKKATGRWGTESLPGRNGKKNGGERNKVPRLHTAMEGTKRKRGRNGKREKKTYSAS